MARKPKIQVLVKYDDFVSYKNTHGTDKLDENSVICAPSKTKLVSRLFPVNEEIFNGTKTQYSISKSSDGYLITFKSNSDTEYRFDLLKDPDDDIYHLAFGLLDTNDVEYEVLTNKNESLEVFSRLIWILKDTSSKKGIDKFIIGMTNDEKKNRIYQYMMKFISGWKKIDTTNYDTGKGIYFEL